MSLIRTEDLNIFYRQQGGDFHAVQSANVRFEANKTYGLIGESGSGKSTLVMGILQLLNPRTSYMTGDIYYHEESLRQMSARDLRQKRWEELAVVFQNSMNTLSPVHRIGGQLVDIYRAHRPHVSKRQIREEMIQIFELLNLKPAVYEAYPHELSGGMMQRVSIAMSLMFNPQVIVFDEATTALDIITQNRILRELDALSDSYQHTKIIVTHDLSVVQATCEYIYIMNQGRLIEEGPIEDIFTQPQQPYTQALIHNYQQLIQ